jgi:hypothetical protein
VQHFRFPPSGKLEVSMRSLLALAVAAAALDASEIKIRKNPAHLRSGDTREWSEFAASPLGPSLTTAFAAEANASEYTLVLRQRDVKSPAWRVEINGRRIGTLAADERDMVSVFPIAPDVLKEGDNRLGIAYGGRGPSDDVELRPAHTTGACRPIPAPSHS